MAHREDHTLDAAMTTGDLQLGSADLAVGHRFADRYVVESLLGRGGMGTVYRVRDALVDEPVALKLLGVTSVDVVERFRREVRLARRITSPHVARTHDLGTWGGVHYLTMELIDGVSLGRKLEGGPLTPSRAARVAASIARGLAAAHAASVVHRDLKPDNVLLEAATGRVVVTDFGIARALEAERTRATGGIAGTPAYMAPEQLIGSGIDGRADLYALGVVLFEMLTGVLPFEGDTPISIAVARLHQAPRDLATLSSSTRGAVPPELAAIVDALLARERDQRPETAAALAPTLDRIADAIDQGAPPAAISMPTSAGFARGVTPEVRTPTSTSGLKRVIAVPAITYRGAAEHAHVPDGIADELVDLLSRTRGISAIGRAAVQNELERDRDTRVAGRRLLATHLLEGTLQASLAKFRLTMRLTDVATGVQVWTHKEDLEIGDGFGVEERGARRVAEALRLALEGVVGSERISAEAMELYTAARRRARSPAVTDRASTVDTLEQVIALAPNFAPALAVHAMACVRAWITPRLTADAAPGRDWRGDALASVKRALENAAHVPETHHAAAMVNLQDGRYRDVARHARAALALAPAYSDAHLLLGQLKLEAGDAKAGLESVEIALDIDPSLHVGYYERARYHGLYGDHARYEVDAKRLYEMNERVLWAQLEVRVGAWRGEKDRIRRGLDALDKSPHPIAGPLAIYSRVALGDLARPDAFGVPSTTFAVSPRIRSIALQMQAEALGVIGRIDESAACVEIAATTVLVDLDWMDRCPLIAAVRERPVFAEWRRAVALRCEDIWGS